jgi:2-polyprenyl-6-methoxyphenol hydroxylase-like FAD-dependent oxidoreductase
MADTNVLIVGAGPTGLVLALWLTKQGVPVRIIDRTSGPGTTSRALAVHARTLELYRQLDLADAVAANGYPVPGVRLWLGGRESARVPFDEIASDLTPYGFLHIFPQDEHERLLIERLQGLGVQVERSTEFISYKEEGDHVSGRLRGPDGAERTVVAAFVAGCDGARSKVREVMGAGYPGGTYPQIFYVADVAGDGPAFNGDLNVELDESDFLAIFPLADKGRVRLIGAIRPGEGKDLDKLTFDDISDRATRMLKLKVDKVNWFSTYHISHRVTDQFRRGRAFLLGDAAHIHTPVGGQGMNTGIGDAINLAWKLRAVLAGRAPDALLDTFEAERRAFALRLVQTTDRFFNVAAAEGRLAEIVRTRVAPIILPQAAKFEPAREYLFRTISQITLNYRGKGLDRGHAGSVHGGDRLPWVKMGERDNYQALRRIGWQAHVYGAADDALRRGMQERGVPLEVYPWSEEMRDAGLRENALYLIRPDTYVAVAAPTQSVDAVEQFFAKAQIEPSLTR